MSLRNKVACLLLVITSVATLVGLVFWRRDRRALEELTKRSDEVCQRLEWDLESVIDDRTRIARQDLHVRMRVHHLDQGLMQLCFGKPIVVDATAADWCWVMTERGDDCYLDVARKLLDAYRARRR